MYAPTIGPRSSIRHGSLRLPRNADRLYEEAKTYLSRVPAERHLFDRLERAPHRRFTLAINHRNDDHFDPNTDTIAWDPYSALRTTTGGRQSPALGLGHEVAHAVENPHAEDRLRNRTDARYDDAEERRVITGSETRAARALHESVRHDHGGSTYRVASPLLR
ncbi:MAG: hypothetical protein ACYDGM_13105 [Vulcanimicrobiaceae bacterium]